MISASTSYYFIIKYDQSVLYILLEFHTLIHLTPTKFTNNINFIINSDENEFM